MSGIADAENNNEEVINEGTSQMVLLAAWLYNQLPQELPIDAKILDILFGVEVNWGALTVGHDGREGATTTKQKLEPGNYILLRVDTFDLPEGDVQSGLIQCYKQ